MYVCVWPFSLVMCGTSCFITIINNTILFAIQLTFILLLFNSRRWCEGASKAALDFFFRFFSSTESKICLCMQRVLYCIQDIHIQELIWMQATTVLYAAKIRRGYVCLRRHNIADSSCRSVMCLTDRSHTYLPRNYIPSFWFLGV